jgi:hypothetical protein
MTEPTAGSDVTTPVLAVTTLTGAGWYPIVAENEADVETVVGFRVITFCWTGSLLGPLEAGWLRVTSQPLAATVTPSKVSPTQVARP